MRTMAEVNSYHVLVYGSPEGYRNCRAQIALMNGKDVVGYIRFHDPNMVFPTDEQMDDGRIICHMPTHAMSHIVDLLRNESPLNFYFAQGRGFFATATMEPVGEHHE